MTPHLAPTTAAPPSVHVRAAVTWLAIFPLVAVGLTVLSTFAEDWSPILRALVLTVVIVPSAVYVVVPLLLSTYGRIARSRSGVRVRDGQ